MSDDVVVVVNGVPLVVGSSEWEQEWHACPHAIRRALTADQARDPSLNPYHPLAGMTMRRTTPLAPTRRSRTP